MTASGRNRQEETDCTVLSGPCDSQHSQAEWGTLEVCTEPIGTGGDDDAWGVAREVAASQMCARMILALGSWPLLFYSLPSSWP